jgi:hypothetical protein
LYPPASCLIGSRAHPALGIAFAIIPDREDQKASIHGRTLQ